MIESLTALLKGGKSLHFFPFIPSRLFYLNLLDGSILVEGLVGLSD